MIKNDHIGVALFYRKQTLIDENVAGSFYNCTRDIK